MDTLAKLPRQPYVPASLGSTRRPPSLAVAPQTPEPPVLEHITTFDCRQVILREIYAGDVVALQRGFSHLSPDEVRMRFLHPLNELPLEYAAQLCKLDPATSVAFVLVDLPDVPEREIRGVSRAYLDPTTLSAEFALVVQRPFTGQGLGDKLMQRLIVACRERGAVELWGDVLIENGPMQHLCHKLGFVRANVPHDPGVQRMTLAL